MNKLYDVSELGGRVLISAIFILAGAELRKAHLRAGVREGDLGVRERALEVARALDRAKGGLQVGC